MIVTNQPELILSSRRLHLILDDTSCLKQDIMVLHNLLLEDELPTEFELFGIAKNVMLGIFRIEYVEGEGYYCYRIVTNVNELEMATVRYPITNMNHVKTNIECNIDYLVNRNAILKY